MTPWKTYEKIGRQVEFLFLWEQKGGGGYLHENVWIRGFTFEKGLMGLDCRAPRNALAGKHGWGCVGMNY
jgi:hypothetical protein